MTEDELVYTFCSYLHTWGARWYSDYSCWWCSCWRSMPLSKVCDLPALFLVKRKLEDHLFGISLARRFHNVSSNALRPTWVPYASTEVGEEVLLFSLKLMMGWCSFFIHSALWIRLFQNCSFLADDWSYERPSHLYFLGDIINIEASVTVYNHVPLRGVCGPLCGHSSTMMWPLFRDIPSLRIMGKNHLPVTTLSLRTRASQLLSMTKGLRSLLKVLFAITRTIGSWHLMVLALAFLCSSLTIL